MQLAANPAKRPRELFGHSELSALEHCGKTLEKCIGTILALAPDTEGLEAILRAQPEMAPRIAGSGALAAVARLKDMYNRGELAVFDEIAGRLAGAAAAPPAGQLAAPAGQLAAGGMPPLPAIGDARLREQVFHHKLFVTNKTYFSEAELVGMHNERLEFLGDAVLSLLVTEMLFERFPTANEGQLSQMRSDLVCNKTLGGLALAYGLDKRLRLNFDQTLQHSRPQKVYADLFEAYVGGVFLETGHASVLVLRLWLAQVMEPRVRGAEHAMTRAAPVDKNAKALLYLMVGTAAALPAYRVVDSGGSLFRVQCVLGADVLGEGTAPNVRDAGLRAALAALQNRALLEKHHQLRLRTDRAVLVVKPAAAAHNEPFVTARGTTFPVVADGAVAGGKHARTELYALLGRQTGLVPEYVAVADPATGYRCELRLNGRLVAVASDKLRKNAMARCAEVFLMHRDELADVVKAVV